MLFGEPAISIEALAEKLRVRVKECADQKPDPDSNEAYTFGVKEALRQIGAEKKLRTFYTGAEPRMKEFMLDVVWWCKTDQGEWAALGVESEWGNPRNRDAEARANEVIEDFEKLLSFKAPMKILFFCADNREMRRAIHSKISTYLGNFAQHVEGEQYLFMEYSQDRCFSYVWEADQNGRCPTPKLKPLDQESAQILEQAMGATP